MNIPMIERLKAIPGAIGIRLEEELPYSTIRSVGDLEIRRYEPFTLARIRSSGDFDDTQEVNFRALGEYIFGENNEAKSTHMTTPVFNDEDGDGWIMSFYIPESEKHLVPNDPNVILEEMPGKTVAVLRYSGNNDLGKMEEARDELLAKVRDAGMIPTSHVWWAQYDQPVSLPMTKRNEVMVKVESAS